MANRLQLKRGSGAPGSIFYEGEPIFDKTGKVLYVGDTSGAGSGAGTSIASGVAYATVLEMLTQAGTTAGAIKFLEKTSNGNHYIGLAAPDSVSSNFTFKLPDGDGAANQVLKTDGSGNLGFATVISSFTLSDGSNTDTFSTGGTLTFSGTTNEIETTVSDDQVTFGLPNTVTVTTGLNINSDNKLSLSETTINQNTGDLTIQTSGTGNNTGDDIIIKAHDDVEIQVAAGTTAIYATGGGSVALTHNGSTKFETISAGATVTGDLYATNFYGDGSNLTNVDATTLDSIDSTSFLRSDVADTKTSGALTFSDNVKLFLGSSSQDDASLYHDATDTRIENRTGDLILETIDTDQSAGADIVIKAGTGKTSVLANVNGSVELWNNGSKKFETTGGGASVTGDLYVSGNLNVVGTAVTFSTETVKVEDRFMELGLVDGSEPTSGNTTWDLGVLFNYNTGAGNGTAKKSGVVWLDNSFIAAVGVATETTGVGNTMPQLNITSYADFVANDLYLGGTASGNQIINSSGQAQNLVFDGGSY